MLKNVKWPIIWNRVSRSFEIPKSSRVYVWRKCANRCTWGYALEISRKGLEWHLVWTVRTNWGNGIVMNDVWFVRSGQIGRPWHIGSDRHSSGTACHARKTLLLFIMTAIVDAVAIFTERPAQQGRGKRSEGTLISTVAGPSSPYLCLCSCRSVRHALSLPGSTLISSWPLYLWTVWTERKMLQIFKVVSN